MNDPSDPSAERSPLIDRLGIGNSGTVANASRDAARRQREDDAIDRLAAAVSRHDAALRSELAEPPSPTGTR